MRRMEPRTTPAETNPRRIWPWLVVALLLLGVVLAVVWVRAEARRIQEQRQADMPPSTAVLR